MCFSLFLEEKEDEKEGSLFCRQLEWTFSFAESLGLRVIDSVRIQRKNGKMSRRPRLSHKQWKHTALDEYKELGDEFEKIPTILLDNVKHKNGFHVVVLDIDRKDGKDELEEIAKKFPEISKTHTVKEITSTGGEHWYFKTRKKIPTKVGILEGVDFLGVQDPLQSRLVFSPPCMGKEVNKEKRHTWVEKPLKENIEWLPKDVEDFLTKELEQRKETKKSSTPAETISDKTLFEYRIPAAIRERLGTEGLPRKEDEKIINEFVQLFDEIETNTFERPSRGFWLKLGYITRKLDCPEEEQFQIFLEIAKLFPSFFGEDSAYEAWISLESENIRLGGGFVNRIIKSRLIAEFVRKEAEGFIEFAQEVEQKIRKEETEEDKKEEDGYESEIAEYDEKIIELIEKRKENNAFFGLTNILLKTSDRKQDPQMHCISALCAVAGLLQYEVAVMSSGRLGKTNTSMYGLVFAETGTGKRQVKKVIHGIMADFRIEVKGTFKSAPKLKQAFRKKPEAKELYVQIDELKTSTLQKAFLNKSDDFANEIKGTLSELHGDMLTTGQHSTENDMNTLVGTMMSLLCTSSFDSQHDDLIKDIAQDQQGIGNRCFSYLPKKEEEKSIKTFTKEQARADLGMEDSVTKKESLDALVESFKRTFYEQLTWSRNRFSDEPRAVFYKNKFPTKVDLQAGTCFFEDEPIEEEKKEQDAKKKKSVQEKEESLKNRVWDAVDPWEPAVLVYWDNYEAKDLLAEVQLMKMKFEFMYGKKYKTMTRIVYHVHRVAALIEATNSVHFEKKEKPNIISKNSLEEAILIVTAIFKSWTWRSRTHLQAKSSKSWATIEKQENINTVESIVQECCRKNVLKTGSETCVWKDIRHALRKHGFSSSESFTQAVLEGHFPEVSASPRIYRGRVVHNFFVKT